MALRRISLGVLTLLRSYPLFRVRLPAARLQGCLLLRGPILRGGVRLQNPVGVQKQRVRRLPGVSMENSQSHITSNRTPSRYIGEEESDIRDGARNHNVDSVQPNPSRHQGQNLTTHAGASTRQAGRSLPPAPRRSSTTPEGRRAPEQRSTLVPVLEAFSERLNRSLESVFGSIQANNTRHFDALRVERDELMKNYERSLNVMGDKIVGAIEKSAVLHSEPTSDRADDSFNTQSVVDSMIEYVRYCACVEFLDVLRGKRLYFPMSKNEDMLRKAAIFVLDKEDNIEKFLSDKVHYKRKARGRDGGEKTMYKPVMFFAMRGLQRAQENIRKGALTAFLASLPPNHALNPACCSKAADKAEKALYMLEDSNYKYDPCYKTCWKNAFKGAVRDAHSTAKSSENFLRRKHATEDREIELPHLPDPDEDIIVDDNVQMTTFSMAIVAIKGGDLRDIESMNSRNLTPPVYFEFSQKLATLTDIEVQYMERARDYC